MVKGSRANGAPGAIDEGKAATGGSAQAKGGSRVKGKGKGKGPRRRAPSQVSDAGASVGSGGRDEDSDTDMGAAHGDGRTFRAKLRSVPQLLDATDRIYRWHWAVRQYRFISKVEGGQKLTNADVILNGITEEWHRALNWLVTAKKWDDVDTST